MSSCSLSRARDVYIECSSTTEKRETRRCRDVDGLGGLHAKRGKSDRERRTPCLTYLWRIKSQTHGPGEQAGGFGGWAGRTADAGQRHRLPAARRGGSGGCVQHGDSSCQHRVVRLQVAEKADVRCALHARRSSREGRECLLIDRK